MIAISCGIKISPVGALD